MPSLAELLRRFRSQGVPGASAQAGVPPDRTVALEAELRPVLACLGDTEREAAAIEEAARLEAARRRRSAGDEARRILADARGRAPTERAAAADARLRQADEERRGLLVDAGREAERVTAAARLRAPATVDDVVRRVLAMGPGARDVPGPP